MVESFDAMGKENFISNIKNLECIPDFRWELIEKKHSKSIVSWRNEKENLELFYNKKIITLNSQNYFIDNYHNQDRVDLVLVDKIKNEDVGVFSIKNISTRPELGKLVGNKKYRKKGIAKKATIKILNYWFFFLENINIYAETQDNNLVNVILNKKLGFYVVDSKLVDGINYLIMKLDRQNYKDGCCL